MKYEIIELVGHPTDFEPEYRIVGNDQGMIVQSDGVVASWDESQGWQPEPDQSKYRVRITEL